MDVYGLVGFPLGHSFSAGYFAEKFTALGLDRTEYRNFPIEHISEIRQVLPSNIRGFNITIPHKQAILPLLSEIDPAAERIGAVNCVKVLPDGRWKGYNTDAYGFEQSLLKMLETRPQGTAGLRAMVLGTGGAAQAVHYTLREKLGITFIEISRTADHHAGRFSYGEITPEMLADHRLIINTTPLGMSPRTDQKPELPYPSLITEHYLYDLVYNPAETAFLEAGRRRGAWIKNGLEMLVLQAERSWEIWNDDQ